MPKFDWNKIGLLQMMYLLSSMSHQKPDLKPNLTDPNDVNSNNVNSEDLTIHPVNPNQSSPELLQVPDPHLDPTPSTLFPSNPVVSSDPSPFRASFIRPSEPRFQPISSGPFSGDLDPFSQPNNRWTERGNLMGRSHFPFRGPVQPDIEPDANHPLDMKPKFDPFGPVPGMGRPNRD